MPAEFDRISQTATCDAWPASADDSTSADSLDAPGDQAALIDVMASAPHVKICENCAATFPEQFQVCPFDGTPLHLIEQHRAKPATPDKSKVNPSRRPAAPATTGGASPAFAPAARTETHPEVPARAAEQPTSGVTEEPAELELERLKAILQQNSGGEGPFQLLDRPMPRKKMIVAVAAVAAVLLSAVLASAYHSVNVRKLRSTVLAAGGIAPTAVGDADIQREIGRKLALVKGGSIQATVEEGVVTLVGRSPSRWEALHAENLASQTAGVKRVKNEVEVEDDLPTANPKKSHGKTTKN